MVIYRVVILFAIFLLAACAASGQLPRVAGGPPGFTAFGEDEEICRRAGEAAIHEGAGTGTNAPQEAASAAHLYDLAYQRCMFQHGQMRQMNAWAGDQGPGPFYGRGNLHSFDRPDAFYSIPYGTEGYGYDGFSY